MKKFLVGLLLIFFTINVQAQWHNRQYGVKSINDLSEEQLKFSLHKAEANNKTGKILTLTGLGVGFIGTIIAVVGTTEVIVNTFTLDSYESGMNKAATGSLLMLGGMAATAVGIPLWAVNASRRNKIEIALIKFNATSFLGNNQPTYFGNKQPSTFGLNVKINF